MVYHAGVGGYGGTPFRSCLHTVVLPANGACQGFKVSAKHTLVTVRWAFMPQPITLAFPLARSNLVSTCFAWDG